MRTKIILFCSIILMLCLWLLLRHSSEQQQSGLSEVAATPTNQQPASSQSVQTNAIEKLPNPSTPAPTTLPTVPRANTETADERRQQFKAAWQTPIEFYGKVVDENTNPVAGVSVQFGWMETPAKSGERKATTESDSDGLFSLQGERGPTLEVAVSKTGYYNSKKDRTGFTYGDSASEKFSPSMLNPVIFHLRKKGKGESLITTDFPGFARYAQLHHDGTPVELDLLKGAQVPAGNGQLELEFWRDVSNMNVQPFNWKLQLSVLGGGLIETGEEFDFEAPQVGYQPSIVINMPATNQNWRGEIRSKYYIQLPDGKYGRFDFYLLPRNGVFEVQSAINPTGSRNLEPQ
jgi:hypothetical protein